MQKVLFLEGLRLPRPWRSAAALLVAATSIWLIALPSAAADPVVVLTTSVNTALVAPDPVPVETAKGYQVFDFDWLDVARQRPVPVRLYLPDAKANPNATTSAPTPSTPSTPSTATVPLIVFSHGIGGSRLGYSYLGRFWAAQGFASLHLQHSGSDRGLWRGNPFSLIGRLQTAAQDGEAADRARDLRFALDQALSGAFATRFDPNRVVAAGHSYGANTTLLVAGARLERQGRAQELHDPRVKAAIIISAPPFYGEPHPEQILGMVAVPTLHITATEDVIRIPGYFSPASDRLVVFEAIGGPAKTLAVFQGGSHNIFSDRTESGGEKLNPQVKAATQALSLAFLRSVFEGDNSALAAWPAGFKGLLARFRSTVPGVAPAP